MIYNAVSLSAVQSSESALNIFSLKKKKNIQSFLDSFRIYAIRECWVEFPVLCRIHSTLKCCPDGGGGRSSEDGSAPDAEESRPGGSSSAGSRTTFPKKEKLMEYTEYPHFLS